MDGGQRANVYGLSRADWVALLQGSSESGEKPSEASSLAQARNALRMLHIPSQEPVKPSRRMRERLSRALDWDCPVELVKATESPQDASVKLLIRQKSTGLLLESVLIPERGRLTQCVSSQVGCAQGCRFCQTGRMGLLSSLTAAEIIAQVVVGQAFWDGQLLTGKVSSSFGAPRVTNVVFMGMGEPLDNRLAVQKTCEILTDPWGPAIGSSRVTVSTVGLLPELARFLDESSVALALSLHSPFDEERTRVMPVNQAHPLGEVLQVLREKLRPGAHVFVQYTLIRGVNDSPDHAEALADRLEGIPSKINLIPLNEHDGAAFRRPSLEGVESFRRRLQARGFVVTLRFSKGRSIDAACGQLVKSSQHDGSSGTRRQNVQS